MTWEKMTVKKMKEILAEVSDDHIVVLSRDAEGNGYSVMGDSQYTDEMVFVEDDRDIKYTELTEELIKLGYTEDEIAQPGEGVPCVVFWPSG